MYIDVHVCTGKPFKLMSIHPQFHTCYLQENNINFSMFQKDLHVNVIVQDQKPVLFDPKNLASKILKDFKSLGVSTQIEKYPKKNIFSGKGSLSSGQQLIIQLHILRGIYGLRNDSEQIYLFVHISTLNLYQLAEMSANLRNGTFYEIPNPGVNDSHHSLRQNECAIKFQKKKIRAPGNEFLRTQLSARTPMPLDCSSRA